MDVYGVREEAVTWFCRRLAVRQERAAAAGRRRERIVDSDSRDRRREDANGGEQ
jgi:hypothetical protein